jgi:phage-related protein (TIGR01555 family)
MATTTKRSASPAAVAKRVLKVALDGWSNLVTGLGTVADKKKHGTHEINILISDDELESIFLSDGLGTRIVTLITADMFREGWEYTFPETDEMKAEKLTDIYKSIMEAIAADNKTQEGINWARLYGGSVILIGVIDGMTMDKPLNPKRIKVFENLRVIDRSDIDFNNIKFQTDPSKPRFGLPEYYPIKFSMGNVINTQIVHHSRVIEIHGNTIPAGATRQIKAEPRYWGVSVLQNVYDHLQTMGASSSAIGSLLEEMSVGKFKIKGLAEILSMKDGDKMIQKRVEVMDLTRSVYRSQYFDTEEDFTRDSVNFSGVPDVLYIIMMLIAACSGYPITRLFGVSPGGMNATGESDMRNYYDMVRAAQKKILAPILLRIIHIISEWQGIDEPYIEFNPLEQLSEKETADLEKVKADKEQVVATTYQAYINAGILEPYEARFLQFGDSLDKIPVPEDMLPPVETLPSEAPGENTEEEAGAGENPEGEEKPDGEEPEDEAGEEGAEENGEEGKGESEKEPEEDPQKKKKKPKGAGSK